MTIPMEVGKYFFGCGLNCSCAEILFERNSKIMVSEKIVFFMKIELKNLLKCFVNAVKSKDVDRLTTDLSACECS
jgi:hypothetical protein